MHDWREAGEFKKNEMQPSPFGEFINRRIDMRVVKECVFISQARQERFLSAIFDV